MTSTLAPLKPFFKSALGWNYFVFKFSEPVIVLGTLCIQCTYWVTDLSQLKESALWSYCRLWWCIRPDGYKGTWIVFLWPHYRWDQKRYLTHRRLQSVNLRRNGKEIFSYCFKGQMFNLLFKFKPLLPGTASCCKNDCNGLSHARARGWRWHKLCSGFCWSSSGISWRASQTWPVSFRGECPFYNLPLFKICLRMYTCCFKLKIVL